jgi:WD40 repeat protein
LATLHGHTSTVRALHFLQSGKQLVSAGQDGTMRLWDAIKFAEIATINLRDEWVTCMAFTSDERTVATAHLDGVVHIKELGKLFQASRPENVSER